MADSGTLTEIIPAEFGGAAEKIPFEYKADGKELCIATPEPDRTLHNMMYNPNYLTMLDQSNCGMAKHMSPAGRNCKIVQNDRFVYEWCY